MRAIYLYAKLKFKGTEQNKKKNKQQLIIPLGRLIFVPF